ncbi:MAG: MaoC family dehydratase [Actinomycetes bacterium]
MSKSIDFKDLPSLAGEDLGYSDWLTVDQERINTFADATDDHQWIHVDPERAKDGPFGGPIAHGYLTLALLIPMLMTILDLQGVTTKVNYGLNKVRFPGIVPAGSKIRLGAKVGEVAEVKGNGYELVIDVTIEVEGGSKPVCVAQPILRFYA